jgi:hypothetical protein
MQRFQRGLLRIVKGPTGGFLASLGIAAILGGVALASPAPPIAAVGRHPPVVVAAPLGGDAPDVSAAAPAASGGVRTEDDPSGRGPAIDPATGGSGPGHVGGPGGPASPGEGSSPGSPGGPSVGNGSQGGTRSAGASPAHGNAHQNPPPNQTAAHEGHHGQGSGSNGNEGNGPSGHGQKPTTGSGGKPDGHHAGGGKGSNGGTGSGSGGKGSGGKGSGGKGSGPNGSAKPGGKGAGSTSH